MIETKKYILGLQHVLAMFGSTVLVPFITGLDPAIALLSAGLGTLLFHALTKKIVPVFLGSSFAFIPAIVLVLKNYGLADLKGGLIMAGLVYVFIAFLIKLYGLDKIKSYFPTIIIAPMIISIGLKLSPIALSMSGYSTTGKLNYTYLFIAFITLFTMVSISFLQKSFFKFMPILIAVFVGYLTSIAFGIVDFTNIISASWFGLSSKSIDNILLFPVFNIDAILIVAPLALVTVLEHLGDMQASGAVVGKDFSKNPGYHRTIAGDGLATVLAGYLGGPSNTTYSENTGVLAITKNYNPAILRIAACMTIVLAFIGKITAFIQSLPSPVMGGISMMLFGLIITVGIKVLVQSKINFEDYRNLVIPAIIIIIGVFVDQISIYGNFQVSGLFLATIFGIILNKVLPNSENAT